MNVQEYILSGIIESYVMGLSSEQERAEFERLCALYPELVAARKDFEEALENHALANAIAPPAEIKVRFLEEIGKNSSQHSPSSNQTKIITMDNTNNFSRRRRQGGPGYLAAASIILLVGLGWLSYHFYMQNAELKNANNELKARLNSSDSILNQIVAEQKIVKDPNITVVNMVGTQTAPKSSANIYWDSASSNVYLVVKNMPDLPSDRQYQLWALIGGKPKDLGVFDASSNKVILKMKNTQKAEAFAITIEKRGGNTSPTLQKMQSLGRLGRSQ